MKKISLTQPEASVLGVRLGKALPSDTTSITTNYQQQQHTVRERNFQHAQSCISAEEAEEEVEPMSEEEARRKIEEILERDRKRAVLASEKLLEILQKHSGESEGVR